MAHTERRSSSSVGCGLRSGGWYLGRCGRYLCRAAGSPRPSGNRDFGEAALLNGFRLHRAEAAPQRTEGVRECELDGEEAAVLCGRLGTMEIGVLVVPGRVVGRDG